ncbi:MAG: hypothetical protein Q3997_02105 [Propionibacteriaceae bacterium]|nr:hypothetical protein [Propionibacteriaceae bacterium]
MINLVKAETSRLLARRVLWIGLLAAFAGCAMMLIGNYWSISPPPEHEVAQLRSTFDEHLADWKRDPALVCPPTDQACHTTEPTFETWAGVLSQGFGDSMSSLASSAAMISFLVMLIISASLLGAEFATGSISNQLSFVPNRTRVYTAKGLVTGAAGVLLSALLLVICLTVGWLTYLGVHGAEKAVGAGAALQGAARGLTLGLFGALLGFALTALLTRTAAVIGIVLGYTFFQGLVYLFVHLFKAPWLYRVAPEVNLKAIASGTEVNYYFPPSASSDAIEIIVTAGDGLLYWGVLTAMLIALSWYVFSRRSLS